MANKGGAVPADPAEAAGDDAAVEDSPEHADVASMTYEQARDELVGLVARLENGQVGLEESMTLWQRGEVLASHCSQWLDRAEARITAGD